MAASLLSDHQLSLLHKIGTTKSLSDRFYLTGDTALAGFYLRHRYSEDLDFFSEEAFELLPLNTFFKDAKQNLGIIKIDFQQSFNRNLFFLHLGGGVLKAEFTYFPFPRIERGITRDGVTVDSLTDIAVNKLFTIYQQARARDYIDLFFICQEKKFAIKDLIAMAKAKFDYHIDHLQLGSQFVKATVVKDYPRLITEIAPEMWQNFFLAEAKKLKSDILT